MAAMRELSDLEEIDELAGDDLLCRWAAQRLNGDGRAWATDDGRAVAVAAPRLATRDRLVVHGSRAAATALVGLALAEVGPTFRPIGDRELIGAIAEMIELPGGRSLTTVADFGWMERTEPLADEVSAARWLSDSDADDIAALLDVAAARSDARPGDPDVDGWAGIRTTGDDRPGDDHDDHGDDRGGDQGRLVAVAALAWSAPTVGYLCGVAVHPDVRAAAWPPRSAGWSPMRRSPPAARWA